MPSIYLTAYNSAEPIPLFSKKKIAHLMPGKVSTPTVFVRTAGYFHYPIAFLQMAIICCLTRLVTTLDSGYQAIFKSIPLSTVFSTPVCTFRFANLTPEQVVNLKAMGLTPDLSNSNLFVGSPSPQHLAAIFAMKPVEDRIRPGHVGSEGYFAWVFLMKGVNAFITARNNTDGRANMRYSLKQSVKFDKEGDVLRIGKEIFKGKHGFGSGRSIITTNDIFLHPPTLDLSGLPGATAQLHEVKALPDESVGFYFPYFTGMNTPDKEAAGSAFSRLFPHMMAPDPLVNANMMRRVISGNRMLAFSDAGLALAHIYKVLELSLNIEDVQLSVVLRGNAYQGMVMICHEDTKLMMYGQVYSTSAINTEARAVDLLDSQAQKIVDLLAGAMELDGVVKKIYQVEDFLSSRRALRSWNSLNRDAYTASDILTQVKDILHSMDFADSYAPLTAANLQRAVTAMSTKEFSGLADFPAYLGGPVLNDRSSVQEALSMFGSTAPSCNTGLEKNCVTISIPDASKSDANLVRVDGKRPLHYLPFYGVPIGLAVQQWNRIISGSVIRLPIGRKDKKEFANLHRAIFQVARDEDLAMLYNGLKSMCGEARASAKSGGKRKREEETIGGAKRGKVMESAMEEYM